MKIKLVIENIALDTPQSCEKDVDIADCTTIQELLDSVPCSIADLSEYYPLSGIFSWNTTELPYIISYGKVRYNATYETTKVSDFLGTFDISDNKIHVIIGYPQAGGPGFLSLDEIWDIAEPILQQIALFASLTGITPVSFIKWLRSLFGKRNSPPHTCFDIVYQKSCWTRSELAELLDIPADQAKNLLTLSGYKYDRNKHQYIQGENVETIKEKLSKIKVHDT